MSQECPEIGLATVYRTLQLLWEIQLVDKINLDDGCVRYEIGHLIKGDAKHNHHHLICRACGRVIPFADDLLDDLEHHIEEATGFHVLDHELKFYGLCRECRGKRHSSFFNGQFTKLLFFLCPEVSEVLSELYKNGGNT